MTKPIDNLETQVKGIKDFFEPFLQLFLKQFQSKQIKKNDKNK